MPKQLAKKGLKTNSENNKIEELKIKSEQESNIKS